LEGLGLGGFPVQAVCFQDCSSLGQIQRVGHHAGDELVNSTFSFVPGAKHANRGKRAIVGNFFVARTLAAQGVWHVWHVRHLTRRPKRGPGAATSGLRLQPRGLFCWMSRRRAQGLGHGAPALFGKLRPAHRAPPPNT
jgi:hypothetical protein